MEAIKMQNVTTALSTCKVTGGLRYTNVQGTKDMITNVILETQMERA